MRCNICGYEDDRLFVLCPSCGQNIDFDKIDSNNNIVNLNKDTIDNTVNLCKDNIPNKNIKPILNPENFPAVAPRCYTKTKNGFKIKYNIDNGDFYYKSFLLYIVALIYVIFSNLHEKEIVLMVISFFFSCFLAGCINFVYNKLLNNCTIEVTPEGISFKSLMKKYFIPRDNIKQFWFERRTKVTDNDLAAIINIFAILGGAGIGGRRAFGKSYANDAIGEGLLDVATYKSVCTVFFEVNDPIFKNDFFASADKKCTRFVNTALDFKNPAYARFLEQEFERVLNIEDEPVEGEYDYNIKRAIFDNLNNNGVI